MLKRLQNTALVLVGISYLITAFTLIATLKPGGIILGLLFIGLSISLYFFWAILKALFQMRELLMLSVTTLRPNNEKQDNGSVKQTKQPTNHSA